MRRTLLLLIVAIAVLMAPLCEAKPNLLNSIKPFQIMHEGMLKTVCTAWATRLPSGKLVYVTANHCYGSFEGEKPAWYVDGKEVVFVKSDENNDLAMFEGGPKAEGLVIALGNPDMLTPIWSAGYPFGAAKVRGVVGVISAPLDEQGYIVYDMAVAPGASGSPVLLVKEGLVIGVQQEHQCNSPFPSWCPSSRGAPTTALRVFLGLD